MARDLPLGVILCSCGVGAPLPSRRVAWRIGAMENAGTRHYFCLLAAASSLLGAVSIEAQTTADNAWTSPTSGNWEDPDWSLGALPAPNQAILFTNAGWKALAIGPNTAQNYPQTMDVDSITVSSPTNSFNVLLLNYAGYQTPLTANAITLGSNTVMTILASTLNVTNTANTNNYLEVGGTVNQGDFPAVNVGLLRVGNIGPGIYNLTNGTLTVVTGYVGGAFTGQFNHYGGYHSVSTLRIFGTRDRSGGAGEYDLYDGALGGVVELDNGALMKQSGGVFVGNLNLDGTYELDGGSFTNNNLLVPAIEYSRFTDNRELAGEVMQTGGTNQTGEIYLGGEGEGMDPYQWPVPGGYVLSNGLLVATSTTLGVGGTMTQTGGIFTNSGPLALVADLLHTTYFLTFYCGQYNLQAGFLAENSIVSSGYFTQTDGTNRVAGSTQIASIETEGVGDEQAQYTLSGGLFTTASVTVSNAIFSQSGGSLITGNLSLSDDIVHDPFRAPSGYFFGGGRLSVSAIQVDGYAVFRHTSGTLLEPGLLTLAGGLWDEQTSGQQFGPLQLSSAYNLTNSLVALPTNSCIMHFADSSAIAWASGVTLIITNWAGSTQGGGRHQVIFGGNSSALTSAQLSDIVFANPAGLPGGRYPARILSTGEIVPSTGTPPMASAPVRQANGTMDLLVRGDVGKVYGMEVSTDLVHWSMLSIQTNQSGTMTFQDPAAPSYPQRFYRAFVEQ